MLGRFIGLLAGCAMAALTVLIYDPAIIGPDAPVIVLGDYEVFRPAMIAAAALLALCGFLALVQPPRRRRSSETRAMPALEPEAAPEPGPDTFSLGGRSPTASPLW